MTGLLRLHVFFDAKRLRRPIWGRNSAVKKARVQCSSTGKSYSFTAAYVKKKLSLIEIIADDVEEPIADTDAAVV